MNVIILCGGLSTRLGDITKSIPKILLNIGGKTVFDWQLSMIKSLEVDDVILAAGHLSDVLKKEIGDVYDGFNIIHVIEDKRLGTGGAIKHALSFVKMPDEPTCILNGDILTSVRLKDMAEHLSTSSDGIILGTLVHDAASYGTLVYDRNKHLKAFKEKEGVNKSGYINGGIYIFNKKISRYFPPKDTFSIEYDVFPNVKDLYVYESGEQWIDIGVPERLAWARKHWGQSYE